MIEIKPEDLIINTMSEVTKGGWFIGTLTGIRLYHKPSGIEVCLDKHRSQHKNKNECIIILKDLLTPFKEGDIIVSESGIGEITKCVEDACFFVVEDETGRFSSFTCVAHTEEGFRYKLEAHIKDLMEIETEKYNSKMAKLRARLPK